MLLDPKVLAERVRESEMAGQPRFGSGRVAASNLGRLKIVRPFEDGSAGRSKLKIGW